MLKPFTAPLAGLYRLSAKGGVKSQRIFGAVFLWIVLLALVFVWIYANAHKTISRHEFLRPMVEVTIYDEGSTPMARPDSMTGEDTTISNNDHHINTPGADFDLNDPRPRIAIILTDIGLSKDYTKRAVMTAPEYVAFSFPPYAPEMQSWADMAQSKNHETMLSLPMEPKDFPKRDPGPLTLLHREGDAYNLEKLNETVTKMSDYSGFTNFMGGKFLSDDNKMRPVFEALKRTDLFFIETRPDTDSRADYVAHQLGLSFFRSDIEIDQIATVNDIILSLEKLEKIAYDKGYAIGVGAPYPVTLTALKKWAQTLDHKDLSLAPLLAVIDKAQGRSISEEQEEPNTATAE